MSSNRQKRQDSHDFKDMHAFLLESRDRKQKREKRLKREEITAALAAEVGMTAAVHFLPCSVTHRCRLAWSSLSPFLSSSSLFRDDGHIAKKSFHVGGREIDGAATEEGEEKRRGINAAVPLPDH